MNHTTAELRRRIEIAAGREPADLVLRNARIVNVLSSEVHDGDVALAGDRIAGIGTYRGREEVDLTGMYLCPGFIDGHVHIESSLLSVPEFARLVSTRGTTAVITDPHEIANVMGAEGIRFMLASSKYCPLFVYVMASSCVPASHFESAGAELTAEHLAPLLSDRWVLGLAEMMNYPGVVAADEGCLQKIALAGARPVDGHCPGLSGPALSAYVSTGIHSDHECTTLPEAREKLRLGLHIMIREGSQARDLDALLPLVTPETLDRFSFVTDDKDVEDLLAEGHIDHLVRRAVAGGLNPVHAIRLATINNARLFGLHDQGALTPGRLANIAVLDNLEQCRVRRTYHAGRLVAADGVALDPDAAQRKPQVLRSSMNVHALDPAQFAITVPPGPAERTVQVIEVREGRIDTLRTTARVPVRDGRLEADPQRDLAKIVVIERHQASGNIGRAFVRGFGLRDGAIASTVAHDSHNLVVVGTNDRDMHAAAAHLAQLRGGFCVAQAGRILADVPLPIAGLMSSIDAHGLSRQLHALHAAAATLDSRLRRPFMAMSFLTLSVIGALKVTDQGLVDVEAFQLIDLYGDA